MVISDFQEFPVVCVNTMLLLSCLAIIFLFSAVNCKDEMVTLLRIHYYIISLYS